MENFSYQKLLDTIKEVSLELFPDPYDHMAGVTAPESHHPLELEDLLGQGFNAERLFQNKSCLGANARPEVGSAAQVGCPDQVPRSSILLGSSFVKLEAFLLTIYLVEI